MKLVNENARQNKYEKCKNSEAKLILHGSTTSSLISLDETDRIILQILQDDFPIVQEPWLEISNRLNVSEGEVISRLKRLVEAGAISKIGPVFDASRLGLKAATLVAMKVPKENMNDVARVINEYENVSHNYEREDEYNLWFTLAASNKSELAVILNEIKQRTGMKDHNILDLPTIRRFKINVHFQITQTNL